MQQVYYCPNCRATVAYGQAYCTNCNTVLYWPTAQTQGQYQTSPDQYYNQQQYRQQSDAEQQYGWDQQQQWYQGPGDEQTAWETQDRNRRQDDGGRQRQAHRKRSYSGLLAVIVLVLILAVAGIGVYIALNGDIFGGSAPVVASFTASSSTIAPGSSTILNWDVTGATSVSITPGVGGVDFNGTKTVSPDTTTTYTLLAVNSSGTARKSVTVTVTASGGLPSIESFSFNTSSIVSGQPAALSWSVKGATSVSIEPGIGTVPSSGTESILPTATTTYKLTASNDAGNSTASATINVAASSTPEIIAFDANPTSVNPGQASTLTWDVVGATSISINQGVGTIPAKGSMQIIPTASLTYALTADSSYGSVTKSIMVTVNSAGAQGQAGTTSPPSIDSFLVSPDTITLGENTTLAWSVTGARQVSISPNIGTVSSSGSILVIPIATTTYKLSALNSFGTVTENTTVTVNTTTDTTPPVIRSFTATPSSISAGATSRLEWDIQGATLIMIDQGIGTPSSSFGLTVSPDVTTTYTLTAINSSGTVEASATVSVNP